ncbi:MAG: hypothetical protein HC905_26800 [Bacteroidales bacterium]|nr:hypothetical protein [Bacteroidales bacterium]
MKAKLLKWIIPVMLIIPFGIFAQPIPAELMTGSKFGTFKLIVSKNFSESSKFGIFHINILQFDYIRNSDNDLMLQDLLFYEPVKNFRITGGGLFTGKAGFLPTAGLQYKFTRKDALILLSPRVNFKDGSNEGDIIVITEYSPPLTDKINLFLGAQSLALFNRSGNIKCSQDLRLGIGIKNMQFGLALGLEQIGTGYKSSHNAGLFIKRNIF